MVTFTSLTRRARNCLWCPRDTKRRSRRLPMTSLTVRPTQPPRVPPRLGPPSITPLLCACVGDASAVPAVFSAAADGTVRVATLNVWFDGKLIAGRLPRNALHGRAPLPKHNTIHKEVLQAAEEDHAREAEHIDPTFQPAGLGLSLHLSLYAKWTAADDVAGAVARLDEEVAAQLEPDVARGDGAIITALSAYHYSQKRMVVAATSTGVIAVHLFNGTLMRAFHYTQGHRLARTQVQEGAPVPPPLPPPTFDEPITAVARYGAQIAYAVRGDVHFLNLVRPSRAHAEQRKCEGVRGCGAWCRATAHGGAACTHCGGGCVCFPASSSRDLGCATSPAWQRDCRYAVRLHALSLSMGEHRLW